MTNLVIVESNAKAATITKYLNNNPELKSYGKFIVIASFGHIRDLPKKKLGIDIDNDFEPEYEMLSDKKDIFQKIKKAAKEANVIYLASDSDRSGHFISESLRVLLKLDNNYKRITFNEITPKALEYAIKHPGKIDNYGVMSEVTRRTLDRLVGFKLSPLLWDKFKSGTIKLSAGRVQSAVMHLIIDKENEIEKFKSSSYWHFDANFVLKIDKEIKKLDDTNLYDNDKIYKINDKKQITNFFNSIKNQWSISDIKSRIVKQNPDAPFITSTLQQEASSKLHMSIKRIMSLAQELYENGYITYMRTDSMNMSETFKNLAKVYIIDNYGSDYYEGGILRKKIIKGAQEAHECIRITDPNTKDLPSKFNKEHKDLYKLIWQRTIAFLMKSAEYDQLELQIKDNGMIKTQYFSSIFKRVKYNGFLIVYDIKAEKKDFSNYMKLLQNGDYNLLCEQINAKNTWQSPPSHYNDAGLVKLMEKNGLARPATMATIIEKLYEKNYIMKTNIKGKEENTTNFEFNPKTKNIKESKGITFVGAEENKIKPTEIGITIDNYLSKSFDYIVDVNFTAHMEADLDNINEGKTTRLEVLKTFWKKFSKDLDNETNKKESKKIIKSESKEIKINNKIYNIRIGPYGPLIEYNNNGKKEFISLKGYLQLMKKEYLDIDEEDIKFLKEMPKVIGKVEGKDVTLHFGPYGLYLRYDNMNVKIPRFALKDFAETKSFTQEQLKSFIDYTKNKKK